MFQRSIKTDCAQVVISMSCDTTLIIRQGLSKRFITSDPVRELFARFEKQEMNGSHLKRLETMLYVLLTCVRTGWLLLQMNCFVLISVDVICFNRDVYCKKEAFLVPYYSAVIWLVGMRICILHIFKCMHNISGWTRMCTRSWFIHDQIHV